MPTLIDLTGQRFGMLTVLQRAVVPSNRPYWWCECDCGETTMVMGQHLKTGDTQSCGCLRRALNTIHGGASNPRYGGKVSPEFSFWTTKQPKPQGWETFEEFIDDVGHRPSPAHFFWRKDNRLPHGPGNTYYTTQEELDADTFTRGEINLATDGGTGKTEAEGTRTTSGVSEEA